MIRKKNRIIRIFCFLFMTTSLWAYSENYVLLINSDEKRETWTDYLNWELKKECDRRGNLILKVLSLPALTLTSAEDAPGRLSEECPDPPLAVIVAGEAVWMIYAPVLKEKWKDVPVILGCSSSRVPSSLEAALSGTSLTEENSVSIEEFNKPYNVTVLERPVYLMENIDLMRRMQPQMKRLVFISDDRYGGASARAELSGLIRKHYSDLQLKLLTEGEVTSEQLVDSLCSYGPADGVLFCSWTKSMEGEKRSYADRYFGRSLFAASRTPIYTVDDMNPVSSGFAGGYYISAEDFARSCVETLDKILAGTRASSIPQSAGGVPGIYLNYPVLQWCGIDSDVYPDEAVYYNRPLSFFERNHWLVYISIAFLCLLLAARCVFVKRGKKRDLMNRYLLRMLVSPVYVMDKDGLILDVLNNSMYHPYDILRQNYKVDCSFGKLFVDEKEFARYVRLINFVIWTGKVREKIIRLRDGSDGVRYLFTRIVRCDGGRVLVMVSDISEKEKVRRQSEEYRFFLKTILENMPISVFVKDMKDRGRFIVWNKRLSEVLGIPASDVKGMASEALPEQLRRITDPDEGELVPLDGTPISGLRELDCRDLSGKGGKKVLSVYHSLISYRDEKSWLVGSAIDITELEARKAELERLNRQYDLILRAMGIMPWTWDLRTKKLVCDRTYVSDKYHIIRRLITKTEEEHFLQIVPQHRERFRMAIQRLCSGEISLVNEEYQAYYLEYPTPLWVESFVVVGQRDALGKPVDLIGATTIVDERKRLEKELLYSKEKAEEANKMKSAFLANMTHEIRTPLGAITGFSSLLAAGNNTPENKEYIQIIENNSRILLKLVSDVLDVSKIESGALELTYYDININASLADLVSSWKMRMPAGVNIGFEPAWDRCMLHTDEVRFLQIMGNYISNAAKYTKTGSITVGYYPPSDGYVRFYVRDTGDGIPADKIAFVFDRFVKLDSFKQGTGLGLAICKMIAECMNGRVGVDSKEGEGSEFWFDHPYSVAE